MAPSCQDNVFGPLVHGCRSDFDFTLLFEQSILAIGPTALLLLVAPPRIRRLLRSSKKTLPNQLGLIKSTTALLLVGAQVALVVLWSSNRVTSATLPSAILSFLSALVILCLSNLEHTRTVRPSLILNVYLLGSLVFDAVQVRTLYLRNDDPAILGLFTTNIVIKAALLLLESRSKQTYLKPPYNAYSPEMTSGVFSHSFFWWIRPLLAGGFRKMLTLDDLFQTDEGLLSEPLLSQMQDSWAKYHSSGKYALVLAVFYCEKWALASIIFPRLCLVGFNYAQPFLITSAIDYVSQSKNEMNRNDGYGLIGATALIYLGMAVSTTHYKHFLNRTLTSFRGRTVALIYAKTLSIQAGRYDEKAAITLMSTDIDRLTTSLQSLCEIWANFIELSIGVVLLGLQIGWICVAPIIVVAVSMFMSAGVTKLISARQREWVKAIQRRVGITSSMLGSMKSVKMMGLSDKLFDTLQNQRVCELELSKKFRVMNIWRIILSFLPPILGPLITFVVFAIQASVKGSDKLSTAKTFSSLALISILTSPAESFLQGLPMLGMATGCLDRIQSFLLSESYNDNTIALDSSADRETGAESTFELQHLPRKQGEGYGIIVHGASVRPGPDAPVAIHDVNFQVVTGSLNMVVGVVGSGKSTLLKAVIGELKCETGSISTVSPHMAYCSQTPWLQNTTVRKIVCGYSREIDHDDAWYKSVMHACAFDQDVLALPDQDDTLIGSRGVTLSGGQKQRLALARAVYSRNDVFVLDDILSAIDAKTEALVVERLLGKRGLLRRLGATVILATHAIQYLPLADSIIVLDTAGTITEQGAFDHLRAQGGFISKILVHPEILQRDSTAGPEEGTKTKTSTTVQASNGSETRNTDDLTRRIGDFSVYKYWLSSIGWKIAILNSCCSLIYNLATRFVSLWLNWYSDGMVASLPLFAAIYVLLAVVGLSAATGTIYTGYMKITPKSGAGLHKILLRSVMRAPQKFFDETDSGITLNRFSQDMTLIDGSIPNNAIMCLSASLGCLTQLALIAIGSTYMALTVPLLLLCVYFLQKYYLRTSRQIRFLDLECKSPLYTHFTETLEGLSTIRAFGWQDHFMKENLKRLDTSQKPYYLLYCIQRWLNLVLLILVGIMAVAVMALATSLTGTTSAGKLGISLTSVVTFNGILSYLLTFWTMLETSMGAIARLKAFEEGTASENKEQETFIPSNEWPEHGAIEFLDVSASYGPNSPALRDVSFNIQPSEKVGICGRTGSGKSSLLSVLLRIIDMDSGTIKIDNFDLQVIPREIIRSRIVTVPQDPFMLAGSVRLNADPASLTSDEAIITALTKVGLWDILSSRGGLEADMTTDPLSHGQQQIFCLARAMLRTGSRILVLDEATSNVDAETDKLMQRLIREEFVEWTILTVAHRLDTILDSDKILVLDGGRVVQFGEPEELLSVEGPFRELRGRGE